jgi:uncharacterized delta-60 repeat protein
LSEEPSHTDSRLLRPFVYVVVKMRLVLVLTVLLAGGPILTAAPADLDPSYGTGGMAVMPLDSYGASFPGVLVQPDGKLLLGGWWGAPTNKPLGLARYLNTGVLDPQFGTDGTVLQYIGWNHAEAHAMALQPDGKIVLAGWAIASNSYGFFVARFLSSGALDPDFATGGVTLQPRYSGDTYLAEGVAIQPDGRIVVVGTYKRNAEVQLVVARYTSGGALDPTFFGGAGLLKTWFTGESVEVAGVVLRPDGKIVVAGTLGNAHLLARYTPDGGLDFVRETTVAPVFTPVGLVQMDDGRLVTAGTTGGGFSVRRWLADGTPDPTFGTNGAVSIPHEALGGTVHGFNVQADGRVVVAGSTYNLQTSDDWTVVRLLADGSPDPAFGTGGRISMTLSPNTDQAHRVAIQADGKLVVSGTNGNGLVIARHEGGPFSPYEQWKLAQLGNVNAPADGNGDGDAFVNLAEYGLVLNPSTYSTGPAGGPHAYAEGRRLRMIFTRDPARNDVTIEAEVADDMAGPWTTVASSVLGAPTSGPGYFGGDSAGPGLKNVEVRDVVNVGDPAHPRRYLRLRVRR